MAGGKKKGAQSRGRIIQHYVVNLLVRALIGSAMALPYGWRVPLVGWIVKRLVAPLARYRRRSLRHLALIWPELPLAERRRIADAVSDNAGRTLIENYSTRDLIRRMADVTPEGPGYAALCAARDAGQPVILVSGHFGNYEAARALLVGRGFPIGGLYRPMRNSYFNAHYAETMKAFGGPVFAQGRQGMGGFLRHLKEGGMMVLLFDQKAGTDWIDFLGRPARTAVSAAELALRYGALLIPFYATRQADGLSFRVELEAPVTASDPLQMTKDITRSLERRVIADPGQWFWVHHRWGKLPRKTG
ncbi:MAG: lysophospholipid acyltransferase family protein [Paracoccaceae bacterium]